MHTMVDQRQWYRGSNIAAFWKLRQWKPESEECVEESGKMTRQNWNKYSLAHVKLLSLYHQYWNLCITQPENTSEYGIIHKVFLFSIQYPFTIYITINDIHIATNATMNAVCCDDALNCWFCLKINQTYSE